MDTLCDTVMVEEIMPRLPPNHLLRLRAACRRYNALALRPDFAARYWQRAGVFFQPFESFSSPELRPRFFLGHHPPHHDPATPESSTIMLAEDLGFLPSPSAREKAYLQSLISTWRVERWAPYLERIIVTGEDGGGGGIVVVHSAAGLLLCCRGRLHPAHFYICNPMTWKWVALPKLPWPWSDGCQSGLLTVVGDEDDGNGGGKRFQVVLLNYPIHYWAEREGTCVFELRVVIFSSDKGYWEKMKIRRPTAPTLVDLRADYSRRILGPSGTAYWLSSMAAAAALAYDSTDHSVWLISLPCCCGQDAAASSDQIIGECQDGGLQFARVDSSALEVWKRKNKNEDGMWVLVHRIGIAELNQKQDAAAAAAFLRNDDSIVVVTDREKRFRLLAFHPTDEGVVFLGIATTSTGGSMLGAVVAYSIDLGTLSLQCTQNSMPDFFYMFPYVHPPSPVQIPPIKQLQMMSQS